MSDEVIKIHPQLLNEYIEFLEKSCISLQESQNRIEKFFRKLGESWQDSTYNITGDYLADTSKLLKKIFDAMRTTVIGVTDYFNDWLIIQKMGRYCRPRPRIGEFYSALKKGDYKLDTYKESNTDVLPDMKNFINELGNYIVETARSVNQIKRNHKEVGDRRTWDSKQYRQLGEILESIDQRIKKQLNDLTAAREDLIETYKKLLIHNDTRL